MFSAMTCAWLVLLGTLHLTLMLTCPLCALFLVVDIPVGTQRKIFMVYAVQQAIEIPQLLFHHHHPSPLLSLLLPPPPPSSLFPPPSPPFLPSPHTHTHTHPTPPHHHQAQTGLCRFFLCDSWSSPLVDMSLHGDRAPPGGGDSDARAHGGDMSSRASLWPCPQPPTTASTMWRLARSTTPFGN